MRESIASIFTLQTPLTGDTDGGLLAGNGISLTSIEYHILVPRFPGLHISLCAWNLSLAPSIKPLRIDP